MALISNLTDILNFEHKFILIVFSVVFVKQKYRVAQKEEYGGVTILASHRIFCFL